MVLLRMFPGHSEEFLLSVGTYLLGAIQPQVSTTKQLSDGILLLTLFGSNELRLF